MLGRLVILHCQQVVGRGIANRPGDVWIASHGIDRDQPLRSRRSMGAGMAVISFDFSKTASCPITSWLSVAKVDTRCRAFWSVFRLWLRREVLPSIATRPSCPASRLRPRTKSGP
jgi:hypothetical protein